MVVVAVCVCVCVRVGGGGGGGGEGGWESIAKTDLGLVAVMWSCI